MQGIASEKIPVLPNLSGYEFHCLQTFFSAQIADMTAGKRRAGSYEFSEEQVEQFWSDGWIVPHENQDKWQMKG